jgi:Integrase core domain
MSSGSSKGRGGQVPAGELSQASYDSTRRERRAAPGGVGGRRGRSARPSRRGGRERNRIWTRDASHFTRRERVAYAIVDVVTRHWIGYLLTSEQTHTQVQLLLARALEDQGLLGEDGLRFEGDHDGPILVARTDNGAEITTIDTRHFMALMAIAQHHSRPGTLTDHQKPRVPRSSPADAGEDRDADTPASPAVAQVSGRLIGADPLSRGALGSPASSRPLLAQRCGSHGRAGRDSCFGRIWALSSSAATRRLLSRARDSPGAGVLAQFQQTPTALRTELASTGQRDNPTPAYALTPQSAAGRCRRRPLPLPDKGSQDARAGPRTRPDSMQVRPRGRRPSRNSRLAQVRRPRQAPGPERTPGDRAMRVGAQARRDTGDMSRAGLGRAWSLVDGAGVRAAPAPMANHSRRLVSY